MFSRVLGRALARSSGVLSSFRTKQPWFSTSNCIRLSTACGVSTNATLSLTECVKQELKLEKLTSEPLPKFANFSVSISGCCATLQRTYKNEQIKIELDANEPIEVQREINEEDEEPLEPFFVPTFAVTVSKPSGDTLTFECSFDMYGDYTELGDEWDNLSIDSVSIQPSGVPSNTVYKVDPAFLSENFQTSILSYLDERGVNKEFTSEVLTFYREFEHHNYVDGFLESLAKFLSDKS